MKIQDRHMLSIRYQGHVGPNSQCRLAVLHQFRREQYAANRLRWLESRNREQSARERVLVAQNRELANKLQALHDRIPVYARIQQDERCFGRTLLISMTFNPEVIVRSIAWSVANRDQMLDIDREFHYLAAVASDKLISQLRKTFNEQFERGAERPCDQEP
jgi:hypothetical protein